MTPLELAKYLLSFGVVKPAQPEADEADDDDQPDDHLDAISPDGWLRDAVVIPSKRPGYVWRTHTKRPGGLLWHWTATGHGTAKSMVKRCVNGKGPTVHFWIEGDGTIYQSVPTTRGAGHAGGPTSKKLMQDSDGAIVRHGAGKYSANSFLLGCEIVNVGQVKHVDGRWMGWPYGKDGKKGPFVPDSGVVSWEGRYYHRVTAAQLWSVRELIKDVRGHYDLPRSAFEWGHCDVDPQRKSDPGPWFKDQLRQILDEVFA